MKFFECFLVILWVSNGCAAPFATTGKAIAEKKSHDVIFWHCSSARVRRNSIPRVLRLRRFASSATSTMSTTSRRRAVYASSFHLFFHVGAQYASTSAFGLLFCFMDILSNGQAGHTWNCNMNINISKWSRDNICEKSMFAGLLVTREQFELIVAVGDQLEHIETETSHSQRISLGSYNASMLVALTHDPVSKKLFFSDRNAKHVNVLSVSLDMTEGHPKVASVIDERNSEVIEGIAYDPIEQSLFWADESKLSIRQVAVDSGKSSAANSKAAELVHFLRGDKPRTLMADPCNRMLYWINWNQRRPTIESSLINGSERQVVIEEDLRTPRGLTLDLRKQKIYWANNLHFGSFRIERSNVDGSDRELVYSGKDQFVFSLAVSDSFIYWTDWEQRTLWALPKDVAGAQPRAISHFNHKPMAVVMFAKQPLDCAALSSNYVGEESVTVNGVQVTSPYESEVPMCSGYCFNDGECVQVGNELECRCTDRFTGDRCQELVNVSNPVPSCSPVGAPAFFRFEQQPLLSALIGVSVFCLALLFSVIGLSIRIHRLSQRPRLKRRRFVGSAKKQSGDQRTEGPVIDIENCCNMNICETPCVEPPSRTPTSERCNGGGKSRGKERSSDKQKLLDCDY